MTKGSVVALVDVIHVTHDAMAKVTHDILILYYVGSIADIVLLTCVLSNMDATNAI